MVLRFLLRYLMHNEKLIQTLADSYPMRKAARFAARIIVQAKHYQERALENMKPSTGGDAIKKPQDLTMLINEKLQKLKKVLEKRRP
ncbi:hypothetical protein X975_10882, partial [Stegodyphus mimosarum]